MRVCLCVHMSFPAPCGPWVLLHITMSSIELPYHQEGPKLWEPPIRAATLRGNTGGPELLS